MTRGPRNLLKLLVWIFLTAGGCGDDGVRPRGDTTASWRIDMDYRHYSDIWGVGSNFVLAADSEKGRIFRFDGRNWKSIREGLGRVTGLHGTARGDVYVSAWYAAFHFDGREWRELPGDVDRLESVWARAADDVYFVGWSPSDGVVYHYNGTEVSNVPKPETRGLDGVWGDPATGQVIAVGKAGTILRYDGSAWTASIESANNLTAVWGAAANDVFAVGWHGTILRFDGSRWTPMASNTSIDLYDIWGRAHNDVYAVGGAGAFGQKEGIILHFDGSKWEEAHRDENDVFLTAVFGVGSSDVFAGGAGVMLQSNGAQWRITERSTRASLNAVWASAPDNAFAVGSFSEVLHHDGERWKRWPMQTYPEHLLSVRGGPSGDVYAVGRNGTIVRFDGRSWHNVPGPTDDFLADVWETEPGKLVVVGTRGLIAEYDGISWNIVRRVASDADGESVGSLWAFAPNDIYAIGNVRNATLFQPRVFHYDGNNWSEVPFDLQLPVPRLSAAWGSPTGDLFATSTDRIVVFDGTLWRELDPGISISLSGVWGTASDNVYFVGSNGGILHYDGKAFTSMETGVHDLFMGVWGIPGGDIFAVASSGLIMRYSRSGR